MINQFLYNKLFKQEIKSMMIKIERNVTSRYGHERSFFGHLLYLFTNFGIN